MRRAQICRFGVWPRRQEARFRPAVTLWRVLRRGIRKGSGADAGGQPGQRIRRAVEHGDVTRAGDDAQLGCLATVTRAFGSSGGWCWCGEERISKLRPAATTTPKVRRPGRAEPLGDSLEPVADGGSGLHEGPHAAERLLEPVEHALRGQQRGADLAMVFGALRGRKVQEGLVAGERVEQLPRLPQCRLACAYQVLGLGRLQVGESDRGRPVVADGFVAWLLGGVSDGSPAFDDAGAGAVADGVEVPFPGQLGHRAGQEAVSLLRGERPGRRPGGRCGRPW